MRVVFLGEGPLDVGRPSTHPRVPRDHEGDLPRLTRRLFGAYGGPERFGYDALTITEIVSQIPRGGRATRAGGKGKDLRDAVVATLRNPPPSAAAIVAVIDARLDELDDLQADAREILRQCQELRGDITVVIGFAVQEIEVWMVASPTSRAAAFGQAVGAAHVPAVLEHVGDPKTLWLERAGHIAAGAPDPELFADRQRCCAWEALDPEVVAKLCPRGFRPLRDEIRALVEARFKRSSAADP